MAGHILSLTFEDEDAVSACFHAGLGDPLVLHLRAYGEHETDLTVLRPNWGGSQFRVHGQYAAFLAAFRLL